MPARREHACATHCRLTVQLGSWRKIQKYQGGFQCFDIAQNDNSVRLLIVRARVGNRIIILVNSLYRYRELYQIDQTVVQIDMSD